MGQEVPASGQPCAYPGCGEPPETGQPHCILHDPNPDKSPSAFTAALRAVLRRDHDDSAKRMVVLSGIVVCRHFRWSEVWDGGPFLKEITWDGATFQGTADFRGARFQGTAYFQRARFQEAANFERATFQGMASFDDTTFQGTTHFGGATFQGMAPFERATFQGTAEFLLATFQGIADFRGATFQGDASFWLATFQGTALFNRTRFSVESGVTLFRSVRLEKAEEVSFQNVDLARVSFLETDVSRVRFLNVTWAEIGGLSGPRLLSWLERPFITARRRRAVYDERLLAEEPRAGEHAQVALLYSQLRRNYESNLQEIEAGDFFVGQMEMRRRDPTYPRHYRALLGLYSWVAYYGEDYFRPFLLYFVASFPVALLYLLAGIEIDGDLAHYAWDWGLGLPRSLDFWRAWFVAATAGASCGSRPPSSPGGAFLCSSST